MWGLSPPSAFLIPVFTVGGWVGALSKPPLVFGLMGYWLSLLYLQMHSLGFMLDPNSTTLKLCDLDQGTSLNLSFLICKLRQ